MLIEDRFVQSIRVGVEDLDDLNHVNNVRYVKWMQDVAIAHWDYLVAINNFKSEYIWVVMNHSIDYKRAAFLGDEISLETHIEGFDKFTCYRIIEIKNAKTGKLITKSKSKWCLIDPETHRPMMIPSEIKNIILEENAVYS
ncbi:acyl-CoA thioesterase [Aureivirga sp. CE67]|uniref:acyl-CoA thioesterase n=1 Tax=Aureivirga sp. CE67 TaxID=1788983 RepID=UPI0018CA0292|nr:acyl-CoA thioesterase [Aureivirga sp. CE67]